MEEAVLRETVVSCEKLCKTYPTRVVAVDRLDLAVFKGEIFGLLGPNGAGKTTTVGMLTTLVVPTSGTATVAGIDVVAHPEVVKQIIGVVSQVNNLDRALTVWENLYYHGLFFGMSSKQSRAAADRLLVDFRLQDRARADVATVSGGMARRLQVARALMHNPSVLFLDDVVGDQAGPSPVASGSRLCESSYLRHRRFSSCPNHGTAHAALRHLPCHDCLLRGFPRGGVPWFSPARDQLTPS